MAQPEFRLAQFSVTVSAQEYHMLSGAKMLDQAVGDRARHALADLLLRESAFRSEHIEPNTDRQSDPWSATRHVFVYSVGVMVDPKEVEAFARQLRDARAEGMEMAAALCIRRAEAHYHAGGSFGSLLRSNLTAAAQAIRERAAKLEP